MNDLYSHLGQKIIRKRIFTPARSGPRWASQTPEDLIKGFCQELKELLEIDDLPELIAGIFKIENDLQNFTQQEDFPSDFAGQIPSFEEFYRQLTPIILRSIVENPGILDDIQQFNKLWKEALRISLEDELYFWQNTI